MSANQYNTTLVPVLIPGQDNAYLIQRPTFVSGQQMQVNVMPSVGESIRVRETITFAATRVTPYVSMIWQNRPITEGFMGHYVIAKQLENNSEYSSISQKIIGKREPFDENVFSFTIEKEWDLHVYRPVSPLISQAIVLSGCNAEIFPAVVENKGITAQNALEYARIIFLLAKKQLGQAATAIVALSQATTAGYKFGNGVIFRGKLEIKTAQPLGIEIPTAIGDIYLSLEQDWGILENVYYDIRFINYVVSQPPLERELYPTDTTCKIDAPNSTLPDSTNCLNAFQAFLLSTVDNYPSLGQAEAARFNKGVGAEENYSILEQDWACPTNSNDLYSYWKIVPKQADTPSCITQFNAFINTGAGRSTYTYESEAGIVWSPAMTWVCPTDSNVSFIYYEDTAYQN